MRELLRRLIIWALTIEQPAHDAAGMDKIASELMG
jgi:hypothetical protein